ncbi:GtrA family protein [Microbacterium sp. SLBN-111]|uniref:GtrA family protein n=1 Tax=Microbacterium sp. SLBN-111 TaxID=3377733 RepID=UPI003C738EFC
MELSRELRRAGALSARFLIVGAVSTAIEIAAFNLLLLAGVGPVAAKIAASLIALVNAYFGNREWAFRSRARPGRIREVTGFLLVNGACTALGAAAVWLGAWAWAALFGHVGPTGLNVVNLLAIAGITVVRFALYHFVVFPRERTPRPDEFASDRLGG